MRSTLTVPSVSIFRDSARVVLTESALAEAAEADRQAARSRIELAAAISAWRQALGLLPQ